MLFLYLILALLFGSFTNVLIYRIPRHKSVFFPASACPNCDVALRFWDKIPVFSYISLLGKCFNCKIQIPLKYPLIELLQVLLAYPFIAKSPGPLIFSFYLILISLVLALAFIDLEAKILPHALTYSGIVIAILVYSFVENPFYDMSISFISNPGFENFVASLIQLGIVFFSLDAFTDFLNMALFKDKAVRSTSPALTMNFGFLNHNIGKIYFLIILVVGYLALTSKTETLTIVFAILGLLYLMLEIVFGYFASQLSGFAHLNQEGDPEDLKTVLGGGDIAMTAFFAVVIGFKNAFLVLFASFNLALIFYMLWKLFQYIKSLFGGSKKESNAQEKYFNQKIPLGAALAICFLAAMMILG